MTEKGAVLTGRISDRGRLCAGCGERIKLGTPKPSSAWAARLRLTPEQVDLLLVAAAEYAEASDEVGEYESAVEFVDWVRLDALGLVSLDPPTIDGISKPEVYTAAKGEKGGLRKYNHRHPDPIPYIPLSGSMRRIVGG